MDIMNMILSYIQSNVSEQIASKFGADTETLNQVIASLTPKLTDEVKNKLQDPNVDSTPIIQKATDPEIQEMAQKADQYVQKDEMIEKGNELLGYITGSKEKSKEIAAQVAEETGFDFSMIKKLLPIVAPIVMGNLGKTLTQTNADVSNVQNAEKSLLSFLDFDNDGSVIDDIMGIAGKFFKS